MIKNDKMRQKTATKSCEKLQKCLRKNSPNPDAKTHRRSYNFLFTLKLKMAEKFNETNKFRAEK